MKRSLIAIICICGMFFITGCVGLFIADFRGLESVSIINGLKEKRPLKVSKQEAKGISILALGFPYMRPMVWNRRFKDLQLRVIYNELSKSKRFRLVNFTEFDQAANRVVPGVYWDALTDQQKREAIKKIGRQLNADAVLIVKERMIGSAGKMVGKSLHKALFVGVMDRPTTLSFEVISSKTGKTIWLQKADIVYTAGKPFIKGMNDDEVIEKIKPSITPLVDNLLASFEPSTPETVRSTVTVPSPSTPKLEPTDSEKSDKIYLITIKNSNVRTAPNIKSQIITTIKKGTKIEKISESTDWFEVRLPSGKTGHIYKPLVVVIPSPEASTHDKPESPQATEKATAPIYKPLAEETQSPEASTHDESESPQATEKTTAPKLPIPPDSPFAKIKEGMGIQQVTDILGQPQDNEPYETGKFVVPFFSSSDDLVRIIYYYKGLGQIHYSLGSGRVKLIVYDPTEDGYR